MPNRIDLKCSGDRTEVGDCVWRSAFQGPLRTRMQEAVIGDDFQIDEVLSGLRSVVDAAIPGMLERTVRIEDEQFAKALEESELMREVVASDSVGVTRRNKPVRYALTKLLGLNIEDEIDFSQLEVNDEFIAVVRERVEGARSLLVELEPILKNPQFVNQIKPLLQKVASLLATGNLEEVYQVVNRLQGDPEFTVDNKNVEVLGVLLFLPNNLRYAVQELLILNYAIVELEKLKAEYGDDVDAVQTIQDVIDYYRYYQLRNDHWYHLMQEMDCELFDEDFCLREKLEFDEKTIRLAERNRGSTRAKEAMGACKKVFSAITAGLADVYCLAGLENTYLTSKDPGHLTSSIRAFFDAESVIRECPERHPKDGRKAVVLEDDPRQMALWRLIIDEASPYELVATAAVTDYRDMAAWTNGKQDLYLLDIQNGERREAGIEIAEEIIKNWIREAEAMLAAHECTLEQYRDRPTGRDAVVPDNIEALENYLFALKRRRLIVFSSSDELLCTAIDRLSKLLEDYVGSGIFDTTFLSGTNSGPFRIEVVSKSRFSPTSIQY